MPVRTKEHLAENCQDMECPRFPCVIYKRGFEAGWRAGYSQGWIEGEAAGAASATGSG